MKQQKQDNEMRTVYECKDYVIKAEESVSPEKVAEVAREINQARSGGTFGELMSLLVSMVVVLMLLWLGLGFIN